MNKTKLTALLTIFALVTVYFVSPSPVQGAGLTAMSVTGTGITSNSATFNTAITPTVNYTTATTLNVDGQTIIFALNGMSVASGQTLAAADFTMTGCTSNTLEASPGSANNGAHEVSITNGSAGNDNPVVTITLDATAGPTPPSCTAGAKTLVVASSQLVAHDTTAGNYAISITTSLDNGAFFFYVSDENDVQVQASVDNTLTFVIRDSSDTTDLPNVNGGAVGPNLCDLQNLSTAGVQTCSYLLKIATNAVSGYYVTVDVDDDLNNAGDTEFINNTATGSAPSSGVEGYNILLDAGSPNPSATATECDSTAIGGTACQNGSINFANATGSIFGDAAFSSSWVMYDVNGPNDPQAANDSALVTHRAEASASTPAGLYTQTVFYTVTPRW